MNIVIRGDIDGKTAVRAYGVSQFQKTDVQWMRDDSGGVVLLLPQAKHHELFGDELVEPSVRIEAVENLLLECGSECLMVMLKSCEDSMAVRELANVLAWAVEYRASLKGNNGYVEKHLDDLAAKMLIAGINILY